MQNWRLAAITLVVSVTGFSSVRVDALETDGLIVLGDPRFNVFELTNSAGDGTFATPYGTVILTFASNDARYCRVARFPTDKKVVLACREEQGWKVVAEDDLSQSESTNPTAVGGGAYMRDVGKSVASLNPGPDFLNGAEIIRAASKGWRNPEPVDLQAIEAGDILRRTAHAYRTSESYLDSGMAETVYVTQRGERVGETRFRTAYIAPAKFRFESNMNDFGSIEVGYIAWMDESGVETWFSVDPDRDKVIPSIQEALDEAAGISRDTSGMIPGLIFPGTKLGGDIVRLTSAVRLEDAQIDGIDCFQVQGYRWPNAGETTTVWIDKESFLIRRVYEERKIKDGNTRTTWFYDPAINVPVDPDILLFDRPATQQ